MSADPEAWIFWLTGLLESYFRFLGFWHLLVFALHVSERSIYGGVFLHLDFITKLHSPFLCTHCSCMGRRISSLIPAASSSDNFWFCFLISAEAGQWKFCLLAGSPWTWCRKMVQKVISTWHSTARPMSLTHTHTDGLSACSSMINICNAHVSRGLFPWSKPLTRHLHTAQWHIKQIAREWLKDTAADEH